MKTKLIAVVAFFNFFLCLFLPRLAGATDYTLTLDVQGSGTVTPDNTNNPHPSGVIITITATPSNGWYFANWSGDASGNVNPLQVTMNSDLVITGNFLAFPTYSVALVTNGQGSIALSPPGGSYYSNTMVTATAAAAAGWVFAGWSGTTNSGANPVSFAVDTNGTLTGTFAELPAFDVEPVSVTNRAGSTVNFTAHAMGTAPVEYQWYFSGGAVTTVANQATLSLTNVSAAQAGNYWVVATNNYGSATSQVASLTVTNSAGPTNLVGTATEGSLLAAMAHGGWIGFGFNGTLVLTNTITITNNVVLDGTGVGVTLSGGNAVPLFYVTGTGSLTITNLTLANGNCLVTNGTPGTPADGGAIQNNGTVTLVGCTLTNNMAQSLIYGGLAQGGAIFNNGGTVLLMGSSLSGNAVVGGGPNSAVYGVNTTGTGLGGAIYTTNGTVTMVGCTVDTNLASSVCEPSGGNYGGTGLVMGGAVFQASGTMGITNTSFTMNYGVGGTGTQGSGSVYPGSPAYGGAVAVAGGALSVEHSQFANNQADGAQGFEGTQGGGGASAYGGAIYNSANCSVADSSIAGNDALAGSFNSWAPTFGGGGGIYDDAGGMLTLNRCSIYGNIAQGGAYATENYMNGGAGAGGGIFNAAQLVATNCTIALNLAAGAIDHNLNGQNSTAGAALGGGVFNASGATSVFMNLTIASNSCSAPGTNFFLTVCSNGMTAGFQIANTNGTFSLHNTIIAYSGTNSDAYGPITDVGYNICSDGSANLDSGSSYNHTDPQLAPLGNYGGPTLCMALLPSSPAIDTGDINGCPNTDQRGYIRPFGSAPDIGAYEYGSAVSEVPYLNMSVTSSNVVLAFSAFAGNTYYLQCSTNLSTWISLSTNGPFEVSTYVSQSVNRQGTSRYFFRLLMQ